MSNWQFWSFLICTQALLTWNKQRPQQESAGFMLLTREPYCLPRRKCLAWLLTFVFFLSPSCLSQCLSTAKICPLQVLSLTNIPKPDQGPADALQNMLTKHDGIFPSTMPTGVSVLCNNVDSKAREGGNWKGTILICWVAAHYNCRIQLGSNHSPYPWLGGALALLTAQSCRIFFSKRGWQYGPFSLTGL